MAESIGKAQIEVGVDATGVDAGVSRAKRSIAGLGEAARKSGQDGARGMAEMGNASGQSAAKTEASTKRMIATIERQTIAMGRTKSQYYEQLAAVRGLDQQALQPYLERLRQVEAAQKGVGNTAGQAELSFSSLKGTLAAVSALFAGVAVGGFVGKLVEVQREFDVMTSSLKTVTGSSDEARRSFDWIKEFADTTPFALGEVANAFIKMKALGLDATQTALNSYANTAVAMGKSLEQMIEAVADASTGEFERLKEFGIKTRVEGEQVAFTFQGLTTTVGNSASEITKYLQGIGNNQFASAMTDQVETLDFALKKLPSSWSDLFLTINQNNTGGIIYDSVMLATGAIEDLTTIIGAMSDAARTNGNEVGAMAVIQEALAITFETVAALGVNVVYVIKSIWLELEGLGKQAKAVAEALSSGSFDFSAAAEIGRMMKEDAEAARVAIDKQTVAILTARSNAEEFQGVMASARKGITDYNTTVGRLIEMHNAGKISADKFRTAVESLQPAQIKVAVATEKPAAAAAAAMARELERQAQVMASWVDDVTTGAARQSQSLADATARLQEQLTTLGMSREELARYNAAKLDAAAASELQAAAELEAAAAILTMQQALPEVARAYRQMAAERRKSAEEMERQGAITLGISSAESVLDQQRAAEEGARAVQAEWQRTADTIEQSLTDALMRGFEDGAGFAENFKDTLKNMFKTLVLRPVIQAMVQPVAGAMAGVVGGGAGGASSLGMAGNIYSLASNAGSLLGLTGAGAAAGTVGAANVAGMLGGDALGTLIASNSAGWGTSAAGIAGGGAMGAIGAALPWIGGALAIASLLGAFDKKPSNKAAGGTVDLGSGELSRWEMQGDKAPSDKTKQARDVLLESIFGIAESVKKAGGEIDLSQIKIDIGERDGFQVDFGEGMQSLGRDAQAALNTVAERLIQDGYEEFNAQMRAIADSLDGDALKALQVMAIALDGLVQFADPLKAFGQAQEQVAASFAELGVAMPTTLEGFNAMVDALDLTSAAGQDLAIGLQGLVPAFAGLQSAALDMMGITQDSVKSMFQSILDEAEDADQAREMGAAAAEKMLLDGLANIMISQVSSMVMDGIIAPMAMSLVGAAAQSASMDVAGANAAASTIAAGGAAGGSAVAQGGAIGGAALAGVVSQAVGTINAMASVMSDPGFQAAMKEMGVAVGGISGAMFGATRGGATPSAPKVVASNDKDIDRSNKAIDRQIAATNTLSSVIDSLTAAVEQLRDIERIVPMRYEQATAAIAEIMARAEKGLMPTAKELESPLDAITSRGTERYSTAQDYERDRLVNASRLESLAQIIATRGYAGGGYAEPSLPRLSGGAQSGFTQPSFTLRTGGEAQDDLSRQVRELLKEVAMLRAASESTARHTERISRVQDRVTRNGEAMQVEEVTP